MPEAFVIRSRAMQLFNDGQITRKHCRAIKDRLKAHGSTWVDDETLRSAILIDLPGHVATKVLNNDLASAATRSR
ncbi:MAG: hypothetical protein HY420_01305 [Candidatus Kerfeldbacteria bacterium]|nr:hypothetical protein [Candidatus Kerfeldbacteria bacterium]